MEKLTAYAVGSITVPALMSFLMPDYKNSIQVNKDDPRLKSEYVNYNSEKGGGTIKALLSHPADMTGKLGGIANMMAVRLPDLSAAVPFYGAPPPIDLVPQIKAPLLLHYAGLDTHVNEGWPAYESALKDNKKEYTAYIYPGVNHGFHNDTTPRYDKAAAELAWKRTIDFFITKLN